MGSARLHLDGSGLDHCLTTVLLWFDMSEQRLRPLLETQPGDSIEALQRLLRITLMQMDDPLSALLHASMPTQSPAREHP